MGTSRAEKLEENFRVPGVCPGSPESGSEVFGNRRSQTQASGQMVVITFISFFEKKFSKNSQLHYNEKKIHSVLALCAG